MNQRWTLLPLLALLTAMAGTYLGECVATARASEAPRVDVLTHRNTPAPAATRRVQNPAPVTFVSVQLLIDPNGRPLAAYQLELDSAGAEFQVVGLVASPHAAYTREPYYDLNANHRNTDRLILANYSLADADDLPAGPVEVATVNLALRGSYPAHDLPPLTLKLTAAYDPDGEKIDAAASYQMSVPERGE